MAANLFNQEMHMFKTVFSKLAVVGIGFALAASAGGVSAGARQRELVRGYWRSGRGGGGQQRVHPAYGYSAPAPAYYAPPPTYYAPPRPVYYAPPRPVRTSAPPVVYSPPPAYYYRDRGYYRDRDDYRGHGHRRHGRDRD